MFVCLCVFFFLFLFLFCSFLETLGTGTAVICFYIKHMICPLSKHLLVHQVCQLTPIRSNPWQTLHPSGYQGVFSLFTALVQSVRMKTREKNYEEDLSGLSLDMTTYTINAGLYIHLFSLSLFNSSVGVINVKQNPNIWKSSLYSAIFNSLSGFLCFCSVFTVTK